MFFQLNYQQLFSFWVISNAMPAYLKKSMLPTLDSGGSAPKFWDVRENILAEKRPFFDLNTER